MLCAALQMCSTDNVDHNLEVAGGLIADAAKQGAAVVSLPENFALMPTKQSSMLACAMDREDEIVSFLSTQAAQNSVFVIGGSIPSPAADGKRVLGSCRVFNQNGDQLARYDKLHLFDVRVSDTESYAESDYTAPGNKVASVDTPIGRVGLTICYDMRFPELYRLLAAGGAQIMSMPSAFTVPSGRAHWEVLLRARAIENLSFVVAPAQAGKHSSGRQTWGHTMIVSPWGKTLNCLERGEGVCMAHIDLNQLADTRKRFPALTHRRFSNAHLLNSAS